MTKCGFDAGPVLGEGAGQFHEGLQPAAASPDEPVVGGAEGAPRVAQVEDLASCSFQEMGPVERLVGPLDGGELRLPGGWSGLRGSSRARTRHP